MRIDYVLYAGGLVADVAAAVRRAADDLDIRSKYVTILGRAEDGRAVLWRGQLPTATAREQPASLELEVLAAVRSVASRTAQPPHADG